MTNDLAKQNEKIVNACFYQQHDRQHHLIGV